MPSRHFLALFATVAVAAFSTRSSADEIELNNGDRLNGTVTALSETSLTLKSERFGEVVVPRDQITLIGLGENGIPDRPAAAPGNALGELGGAGLANPNDLQMMLNDPQIQQQFGGLLGEALGGRSMGDLQRDLNQSRRGLEELQRDLGGIEGEAIGSYLRLFDVLGGGLGAGEQMQQQGRQQMQERDDLQRELDEGLDAVDEGESAGETPAAPSP